MSGRKAHARTHCHGHIKRAANSTDHYSSPAGGAQWIHLAQDGSGSLVALDSLGNLYLLAPGSNTLMPMGSAGYTNFVVDGSGSVLAWGPYSHGGFFLQRFAPGASASENHYYVPAGYGIYPN